MSLNNKLQTVRQRIGKDSTNDWYSALTFFVFCLVIAIIINIWIFVSLTITTGTDQGVGDKKLISISQDDIQKAVKNISERNVSSRNVSGIVRTDPSL